MMKSKTRLILWLGLIFLIFLVCAIWFLKGRDPWLLITAEIAIPILFGITVVLINKSFRPVETISRSMSMLREGDFSTTLVNNGNPDADGMVEVYNSMIKRLREERLAVREANQFLDLLIESSPLGIVIVDFDERIVDINPAAYRFMAISPADYKGLGLRDLANPLAKDLTTIEFDEKRIFDLADGQKYRCRKLFFMDHGFRHPFYIIEEFSEEIRHAEKAAYSKLIRMMAHEVNNTVGAVNSILSTVLDDEKSFVSDNQDEVFEMLGVAVQRNYRLNRFMQNFSDVVKLPLPEKEPFDLNRSLNSVIQSFSPILIEKKIRIQIDFNEQLPPLLADQSQMEQVFINLIKNSIEAIGSDGTIGVKTQTDPIMVLISDDGPGLSAQARDLLYTPFFSTKSDGQGVGLTVVREILVNHGFHYHLSNREEGGTEFIITCP